MSLTIGNVTIAPDGTATWTGNPPTFIGSQPVWYPPRAPDAPVQGQNQPSLNKFAFNDGYTQVRPKGMNHIARSRSISFSNVTAVTKDEIMAFLNARGGFEPFWWQQPEDLMRRWRCEQWGDLQQGFNRWQVSASLVLDWTPP